MKVLFLGTSDFACAALRELHKTHDVVGCITRPDKPSGRGRKLSQTPVRQLCEELEIDVHQPADCTDIERVFDKIMPDIAVVVAYGVLLPQSILEIPAKGCVNLHASLLPRYRGAAPINWAIVRGEEKTGVTVIRMSPEMDAGPILGAVETNIDPEETAGELHDRLALLGAPLLTKVITDMESEDNPGIPQEDSLATYAPMMMKSTGLIDWNRPFQEVKDFIRGMTPWPGAHTWINTEKGNIRLVILSVVRGPHGRIMDPGMVMEADNYGIEVACSDGSASIIKLKPEGRTEMTAAEFLRGNPLGPNPVND